MPKPCIFCGQLGGNEEHIVSRWILRDLGMYSLKSKMGFGNQIPSGEMEEISQPQRLGSFVTDSICATCNNGWMSRLESQVKPLLSPLLAETWPINDRALLSGLFLQSHIISRWLLKTACTFGTKMSVEVPDFIRSKLYQGRMHPEVMVDLSLNDQSGLYVGMSRSWNCYAGGKMDSMKVPDHSFRFVWQLRHLAMRVAYFPGCEKMMSRPRFPVRLAPRFCVPPDVTIDGVIKPAYRYGTLQELEHDTFYSPSNEVPIDSGGLRK